MIFTKTLDIHSVIHFVGCYALVPTLMSLFGMSVGFACIAAFLFALGWEVLDEASFRKAWKKWFLDPRGADGLDVFVDIAGILLAFLIF